ncbi:MAG: ATP-binding protein [Oscillospiraceae bacterium]|nr:ATP-binding protein [Oscillospiraceae bacterium]
MDAMERQKVINALTARIREQDSLRLSQVSSILAAAGLSRDLYNGLGPKRWLQQCFSNEFVIEGSNGMEVVLLANTDQNIIFQISSILRDYVKKNGSILLANIPATLQPYGIDYKKYSDGMSLRAWLRSAFPEFIESDNGLALCLRTNELSIKLLEIRQMHAFAFMNKWPNNIKKYQQLSGDESMTEGQLRSHIAHRIALALLGVPGIMLLDIDGKVPRIAFHLDLKDCKGRDIYCVVEHSASSDKVVRQPWQMVGFCITGGDDEHGLGQWMESRFKLSGNENLPDYKEVEQLITHIDSLRVALLEQLPELTARTEAARCPRTEVVAHIQNYEQQWRILKDMLSGFRMLEIPADADLETLRQLISEQNRQYHNIRQALQIFDRIVECVREIYNASRLRWSEDCTPVEDAKKLHEAYDSVRENLDYKLFSDTIKPYISLLNITRETTLSAKLDPDIKTVTKYFKEMTSEYTAVMLLWVQEDVWKPLEELVTLQNLLEECIRTQTEQSRGSKTDRCISDPDTFLNESINPDEENWYLRWLKCTQEVLPDDVRQQALIMGASEDKNQKDTNELTFCGAADRLLAAESGYDQTAEKYLLMGLNFDAENCVPKLLEIYRKQNRPDSFEKLWVRYSDSSKYALEDLIYWLQLQCQTAPDDALLTADVQLFLQYRPDSLRILTEAAEKAGQPEKASLFSQRLQALQGLPEPNGFEQALINADIGAVRSYAQQSESLRALGYTEGQIDHICMTLESGDYGIGVSQHDIAYRLYQFQQNQHMLAECYYWNSLALERDKECTDLLQLLVDEARWEECIALYDNFKHQTVKNIKTRKLYLTALLYHSPEIASNSILDLYQDFLWLMCEQQQIAEHVRQLAKTHAFYAKLIQVTALLDIPFIKSVSLMDNSMRETVFNQDLMVANGFSLAHIEEVKNLYKSDSYPHGSDVMSTATRLYMFAKLMGDAAEQTALLALPLIDAAKLLWTIYIQKQDYAAALDLAQNHLVLRSACSEEYLQLLFRNRRYQDFLTELPKTETTSSSLELMETVSRIRTNMELLGPVLIPSELAPRVMVPLVTELISALYETENAETAAALIAEHFAQWVDICSGEELVAMITGGNELSDTAAAEILKYTDGDQNLQLSIFCSRQLGLSLQNDPTDRYFSEVVGQAEALPLEEQLTQFQRLRKLYGRNMDALEIRIVSASLRSMLNKQEDLREIAKQMNGFLRSIYVDEAILEEIYRCLEGHDICYNFLIYDALSTISAQIGAQQRNLQFLVDANQRPLAASRPFFQMHLAQQFLQQLIRGELEDKHVACAESLCIRLMESRQNAVPLLCLVYLESRLGKTNHADATLLHLASIPADTLGDVMAMQIADLQNQRWQGNRPTVLSLFQNILNEEDLDGILQYMNFCGRFELIDPSVKLELETNTDKQVLTPSEVERVLILLFRDQDDTDIWRYFEKLPLNRDSDGYARLYYLYCQKTKNKWKQCLTLCAKHNLYDLHLRTLIAWIDDSNDTRLLNVRKYLSKLFEQNANFPVNWKKDPLVGKLLMQMIGQVRPVADNFSWLQIICTVAVKSGMPEHIRLIRDKVGNQLFGSYCDLGVVVLSYLLLDRRIEEAYEWLTLQRQILAHMKYQKLVDELAGLDLTELEEWTQQEENQMILQIILPDGNQPNIHGIGEIVVDGFLQGREDLAMRVLMRLQDVFEDDYGLCNALYDLCISQRDVDIPMLHRLLRTLTRLRCPTSYYRCTQIEYGKKLAALNAILIAQSRTHLVRGQYLFDEKAGDYLSKCCPVTAREDCAQVNQTQDAIYSNLVNRSGEDLQICCDSYMSWITGEWSELISRKWEERGNLQELSFTADLELAPYGLSRSILRVVAPFSPEETEAFMKWLCEETLEKKRLSPNQTAQIVFVQALIDKGYLDVLRQGSSQYPLEVVLGCPIEDCSLYETFYKNGLGHCAQDDHKTRDALAFLISGLACHSNIMAEYSKAADNYFRTSRDAHAYSYYHALFWTHKIFHIFQAKIEKSVMRVNEKTAYYEYLAFSRVCGLFSDNEETIQSVNDASFSVNGTINMVQVLIRSERAGEILRLRRYLSPAQMNIADLVLIAMNPDIPDDKKLASVISVSDPETRAYLLLLLKWPYHPQSQYSANHLRNIQNASKAHELYLAAMQQINTTERPDLKNGLKKILLYKTCNSAAFKNMNSQKWWEDTVEVAPSTIGSFQLPEFAQMLEPITDNTPEQIDQLLIHHKQLGQMQLRESFEQRMAVSEEILRCVIGLEQSEIKQYEALLRYGVDCYYVLYTSASSEDRARSHVLMKQLVNVNNCGVTSGDAYESFQELIRTVALSEMLGSYESIREMVEDYSRNSNVFHRMRSFFHDNVQLSTISSIYDTLENLGGCYALHTASNFQSLRKALERAYLKLNALEVHTWAEIKKHMQMLITDEINNLSRRPELEIKLLNEGVQGHLGHFSGYVVNYGLDPAENVTLHASYGNGFHSEQYTLARLEHNAKAVFEIRYSIPTDETTMQFHLDCAYTYGRKNCSAPSFAGTFKVSELPDPGIYSEVYDTGGSIKFTVNETGKIYSPIFFGRRAEIGKMCSLVQGKNFSEYHSAIVYGLRRTGKTSLLNYFKAYVDKNCENTLCVRVDVLISNYTIHDVFIKRVLNEIKLPELNGNDEWDLFRERWSTIPEGQVDCDPKRLDQFYRELYQFTNKGLMLIVDEIDRLFERIISNQSVTNLQMGLFDALTSMLDSEACAHAIHFVLCGSNWLIRYAETGDYLQQMFHRIGGRKYVVGKLPRPDVDLMLKSATQKHKSLVLTEDAKNMIWEYTGGLVWFTKLLANAAIARAVENRRTVVYPYDVYEALPKILTPGNCRQFYEGCYTDGPEMAVIDAIQSLATRKDACISINQLCDLMKCEAWEVENALRMLSIFNIIERESPTSSRYRFCLDIYRRYFRSERSSKTYEKLPDEIEAFTKAQKAEKEPMMLADTDDDWFASDDM